LFVIFQLTSWKNPDSNVQARARLKPNRNHATRHRNIRESSFNQLLTVLKQRLPPPELEIVLREAARALAVGNTPDENETVENRAQKAIAALESLGGASSLENADGKLSINSVTSCPFDVSVSAHPEVCRLAEAFLSEVTGLKVREHCQKGLLPKCSFEIAGERES